ncbi:MAG: gluconate 2-dehydrogenase subunit 3 family protein [Terriglobia bacterium]
MKKDPVLTNLNEKTDTPTPVSGMNRREMVRRLATVMTAAPALTVIAAAPGLAAGKPPVSAAPGQAEEEQKGASGKWTPAFFDPHQYATFTVLAERIIPGSTDAQVGQFVDLLLSVEAQQAQKRYLNSLSAFEAYSLATYQKPFKDLSEDQQNQVLTVASTAKPGGGALPGFGGRRILGPRNLEASQEEKLTLRDHFELLKRAVVEAYFSSEPGMKYLGWTGQVMWSSFPGCQHSDQHA